LLDDAARAFQTDLLTIRRHLHAHPEPSGEEFETTHFIVERLTQAGLHPTVPPHGVGAMVDVDIGSPTVDAPRIALRGDIDALRLTDKKAVPWASKRPGLAHACGHDCHTTMVLMAACAAHRLNQDARRLAVGSSWSGAKLRFLFQPAEESAPGARWLVDSGAMDGIAAILGVHVDPLLPVGTVGIRSGVLTAHCDEVTIRIEGRGGHAARPHHTTDPISAAAQLISLLHQNLPRAVDARSPSVFTIGKIHGGEASNVIPDHVAMSGSLRTTANETRSRLIERMQAIGRAVEQATGNHVTIGLHHPLGAVTNDARIANAMEFVARQVVGASSIRALNRPSMGGEDFAVYLERAPGFQVRLGCAGPAADWPPLHSPLFDVDEQVLEIGLAMLLRGALLLAHEASGVQQWELDSSRMLAE
jgi:amidohydrolase